MIETLLQDLRFALRTLAKTPTFTAAVVVTVALGVGATTAISTVVDGILLRPLPFDGSERVVMLCETNASVGGWCGASPMNVADWARASRALDSAGVARTEPMIARRGSGEHFGVQGGIASPGFFQVLAAKPRLGRAIEDRDMPRGANHVVVLSHAFWQARFGGDLTVVGRIIVLDDQPYTIVGVLAARTYIPLSHLAEVDIWKPLTASVDNVENRSWRGFTAIGRMATGVTAGALQTDLELVRAQLEKTYPEANRDWGLRVVGLREQVVGDVRPTLWIFLGAVGFVLLIACANVASLLMVRATGRAGEFAVRASLGARGRRLVQQLVTESLVLSLAGGALGLFIAWWMTSAFLALAPATIPRLNEVAIDLRMVLFTLLLSAVTAVIFGSAPARQALRSDLADSLKGLRTTRGAEHRLRSVLVVGELALALMLLVSAGLLTRSFGRLLQWDPGFSREGLMTSFMLPPQNARNAVDVMERVRDEVATLPGVQAAALGSAGPLFGGHETGGLQIEGRAPFAPTAMPTIEWFDISPQYFVTLGVRVVRGRPFTADDRAESAQVGIVNETFARRFLGGANPIGQRVNVQDHACEIVGVVADIRPFEPDRAATPQMYWPIRQYRRGAAYLIVRTPPGTTGVERAIQARADTVMAGIQLGRFLSLQERVGRNLVGPRFNMALVGGFAAIAMLLAAVGVYGVLAHSVLSRTREIGTRIALGATPRTLLADVVRQGLRLTTIGIVAGGAGALATGRLLTSLLYGVPVGDPITLTAAIGLFVLVAVAACWLPARRASRMDPMVALRTE